MKRLYFLLTHKGWFGLCPVYFGDLDSDCPAVEPRHWLFAPLMWLSEFGFWMANRTYELMDPYYEPGFPLQVTGELSRPISFSVDVSDT